MRIDIRGIASDQVLQDYVAGELRARVSRLGLRPLEAQASFTDENGPKGGMDIRCGLTVKLPRRSAVHTEDVAETARQAFDGAVVALERQLARDRERARELRRRPKKYFVAKTLLEGGGRPEGKRRKAS